MYNNVMFVFKVICLSLITCIRTQFTNQVIVFHGPAGYVDTSFVEGNCGVMSVLVKLLW